MPEQAKRCNSCGIPLKDEKAVEFRCPGCGSTAIGRCGQCRDQSANYHCPQCGFVGP